ncbi:MAG: UDP-N-acetylmuramoylalanyl-D-glutamate--2,6-diaminopimelate ligase, partial [Nitrospiraceae bacterium]|nr:UDP-N-acetylmuramoylalanyl-D-glutamate--2,6-diaminopimelate ligase [Nitrospiraceae bacterium]
NALNVLSLSSSKRIAIIGDMLELGDISEVSHRMIGLTANSMGIDFLIGFGRNVRYAIDAFKGKSAYFDERSNLLDFIDHYDFSHSTVLVKGSRANGLEDIVRVLLRRYS